MTPPVLTAPLPLPRTLSRLTATIGLALTASTCGGPVASAALPASTFPSDIATPLELALTTERKGVTFPLLNGSLRLQVREDGKNAGVITGTYTGSVSQPASGRGTAVLNVRVRNSTGVLSSIASLTADGSGTFIGEGDFALSLLLSSQNEKISVKVQGTTTISCSAEGRILATLRGTGSTPRLGSIEIELRHEVGNTNCFP
jgi:hypothetical protein